MCWIRKPDVLYFAQACPSSDPNPEVCSKFSSIEECWSNFENIQISHFIKVNYILKNPVFESMFTEKF